MWHLNDRRSSLPHWAPQRVELTRWIRTVGNLRATSAAPRPITGSVASPAAELRTRGLLSLRIYFVLRKLDMGENAIVSVERIEHAILVLRGHKVKLDTDLALLYDVEPKTLNRAVKRNLDRFPV